MGNNRRSLLFPACLYYHLPDVGPELTVRANNDRRLIAFSPYNPLGCAVFIQIPGAPDQIHPLSSGCAVFAFQFQRL